MNLTQRLVYYSMDLILLFLKHIVEIMVNFGMGGGKMSQTQLDYQQ